MKARAVVERGASYYALRGLVKKYWRKATYAQIRGLAEKNKGFWDLAVVRPEMARRVAITLKKVKGLRRETFYRWLAEANAELLRQCTADPDIMSWAEAQWEQLWE